MRLYVGNTDRQWFEYLRTIQAKEVNFWRPSAKTEFRVLEPGELFLFRLKSPIRRIVGGGRFSSYMRIPLSVAWDIFGEKNGMASLEELRDIINHYRERFDVPPDPDPFIGCISLNEVFYLDEADWIAGPADWAPSLVQGKSYASETDTYKLLISALASTPTGTPHTQSNSSENKVIREAQDVSYSLSNTVAMDQDTDKRYGAAYLTQGRLGQSNFRMAVMRYYNSRCSISGCSIPQVLEAAHIKPYSQNGPHAVNNGILLRKDIHSLFDQGYITIDPHTYKVKVSSHIKLDTNYGQFDQQSVVSLPKDPALRPLEEYLLWHNNNVFQK